jgi:hypothetical protein
MIKFKATSEKGQELLGFGITAKNVERLKKGDPIFICGRDMDLPFDVIILYGETEQEMVRLLRTMGAIDHTCEMHRTDDEQDDRATNKVDLGGSRR